MHLPLEDVVTFMQPLHFDPVLRPFLDGPLTCVVDLKTFFVGGTKTMPIEWPRQELASFGSIA